MRDERQVRERAENIERRIRDDAMLMVKYAADGNYPEARALMDRIEHQRSTLRALCWALGGAA